MKIDIDYINDTAIIDVQTDEEEVSTADMTPEEYAEYYDTSDEERERSE